MNGALTFHIFGSHVNIFDMIERALIDFQANISYYTANP